MYILSPTHPLFLSHTANGVFVSKNTLFLGQPMYAAPTVSFCHKYLLFVN